MANKVIGAPGIVPPTPNTNPQSSGKVIPWRRATMLKYELGPVDAVPVATPHNKVLEGTGFFLGADVEVQAITAGNAAAVAFKPDAPFSALTNVTLKDVGPDLVNVSGYGLYLANLYGGFGQRIPTASVDPLVYHATAGAVATGGSFRYRLRVPAAINPRALIGLLGNQDRAVKLELRTDTAPTASLYSVAPTAAPTTYNITRHLWYATVPAPTDERGRSQESVPPFYEAFTTLTELQSESAPVSSGTIQHFLRGIGNTIRFMILMFYDSLGARSDLMIPNRLTFRVGSDPIFSETSAHRRQIMHQEYGFDAPAGVLAYSWMNDFSHDAGFELGDDWLNTRNVANAQLECTYPVFVNTPGTLRIVTGSLIVPEGKDLYPYMM